MILTFIYFVLILGITVFIHELGHFLWAKKAHIYVYEFSIGMGPQIFKFRRKNDETEYSIRLFPIGGFVQMAGEEVELDKDIPEDRRMQSKTWFQKFMTIIAGVMHNFIFAIILLFIVALVSGASTIKPYIGTIDEKYPIASTNLESGDKVLKMNGKKISTVDKLVLELQVNIGKDIALEVEHENGKKETIVITPVKETVDEEETYHYGFSLDSKLERGIIPSIKYAFAKFGSLVGQICDVLVYLFQGKLSLNNLSGPIGIFNIVGETAKNGFINLVYLTGYLSLNVGFMNLLPIPAFDGGRILFLIIEKIKGKPVSPKFENIVHSIGFILLMLLMVVITFNDIIRIIK